MALTAAQQTDAYRFFSIAFDAAPGVEYMNQIADAYGAGMTTQQVVNAFVSKSQFTNVYPTFLSNEAFAAKLVDAVVEGSASAAAATQAKADVATALNSGMSRGDVIYRIFNNLANKPAADADWGNTAKLMANKVAVAQYYTEVLLASSTDLSVLQAVLAGVTPATDVSTPEAIARAIGDAANVPGKTFLLTGGADTTPTFAGGALNDVFVATNATLTAGDRLDGGAGNDSLIYSANNSGEAKHGALFMTSVERLQTTVDNGSSATFDLSGTIGLNTVAAVNSTGNTVFNQVTSVPAGNFTVEADTVTDAANIAVHFQDSKVVGTTNEVLVKLLNNYNAVSNAGIGILQVGSMGDVGQNSGIETISVTTGEAASLVFQLDSDISTLNVAGDQNLTITTALNSTVDTVAAGSFTGALNINLTGNAAAAGEGALSITTGSGNDVIDLLADGDAGRDTTTVTRNATISTRAGNDTLEAGLGDDNINLGEGNDTLVMTTNGLSVADLVVGGAGTDLMILNAKDTIAKSEAERVTQIETLDLRAADSSVVVTDSLVNTADGGMFTITTANAVGGHTVDLTNVTFSNTNKFTLTGQTATSDTVIANDATVNAKAILNFGQDGNGTGLAPTGFVDTLRIVEGGNFTADDFANVTGLDAITLQSNSNIAQTYNIQLVNTMFDTNDSTTPIGGDGTDDLVITADRNVPQNSVINLNVANITGARAVTVRTNSNVTVNLVDNAGTVLVANATGVNGIVNVISSLQFTENSDNLVGSGTFTADSLDQLDTADYVSATGIADVLQLNFAVQNPVADLDEQFNLFGEDAANRLEIVTFNTNNNVSFRNIGVNVGATTLDGVTTVNFGAGNDTVTGNTRAATFNFGNGNNAYTEVAGSAVTTTVRAGTGTDSVTYGSQADWTALDTITLGTGNDTVNVTSTGALNTSTFNLVSGVDNIVYNASGAASITLTIDDNMVDQADNVNLLNVNVNDAGTLTNNATAVAFTAAGVVSGNAVNVTISGNAVIAGAVAANAVADFIGGAGNDLFTMRAANVAADGTIIRGNAGADVITLRADVAGATDMQVIEFATANDGAAQGANTGFDLVTGFQTTVDKVQLAVGEGLEGSVDSSANNAIAWITDAAIVFGTAATPAGSTGEALLLTQVAQSLTDADLTEAGFVNLLSKVNVLVNTNGAVNAGGLIVAQGQTDTAVYFYGEQNGVAGVQAADIKLLGVFDSATLVAGDFQIA